MSHRLRNIPLRAVLLALACVFVVPGTAPAKTPADQNLTGGSVYVPPPPPAQRAKLVHGIAVPPASAPTRIKRVIAAANLIIRKPYVYGGGHKPYPRSIRAAITRLDRGYDCSGSVSFALFGGRFLKGPLDSSSFMSWARPGKGRWITVYTNPGHAYVVIGGMRFDTSGGDRVAPEERRSGSGPRWRKYRRSSAGYVARHPSGF
jgi:hypothetical protein